VRQAFLPLLAVPERGPTVLNLPGHLEDAPGILPVECTWKRDEAVVARAFWCGVAILDLWQTCETVSLRLGWDDWLKSRAGPIYEEAAPFGDEAVKRRRELEERD